MISDVFFAVMRARRYPLELVALSVFPNACLHVENDMRGDIIYISCIRSCAQPYHVQPCGTTRTGEACSCFPRRRQMRGGRGWGGGGEDVQGRECPINLLGIAYEIYIVCLNLKLRTSAE